MSSSTDKYKSMQGLVKKNWQSTIDILTYRCVVVVADIVVNYIDTMSWCKRTIERY